MRPTRSTITLLAASVLVVAVTACADDSNTPEVAAPAASAGDDEPGQRAEPLGSPPWSTDPEDPAPGDSTGPEHEREHEPGDQAEPIPPPVGELPELSDDEVAGLLWMREEEQLAHDVYVALGDRWGIRIFENISASEQFHIDSIAELLERYAIDDPMAGHAAGTFTIPEMQELYDQLVAEGAASLIDALEVGAFIEELDIVDLQVRAAATDVTDIDAVYARLEKGSRNHLRAFTSQLERRDAAYTPTQLDQATFDEIVSGETERGH